MKVSKTCRSNPRFNDKMQDYSRLSKIHNIYQILHNIKIQIPYMTSYTVQVVLPEGDGREGG